MTVPSGRAVTADLRCSTFVTGTGTTSTRWPSRAVRSCSMPEALDRPPTPTQMVRPCLSTSPPSSVPGASISVDAVAL